jgi:deoxycytidylate deaminase
MIEHAKKASRKGYGKYQLGAAIYDKKGKLISVGWNKRKTHPRYGSFVFNRIHAEGDALIKALKTRKSLKDAYIVVYRNNGNKAKPCPCCESMLREAGLKRVYYTDGDDTLKQMRLN